MFTLVTACMNREQHLRKTLHSWLKLPQIAEVVIVDWSNNRPLDSLRAVDERVKIVRVEGEPRWILSYAYNIGVDHATQPLILKCDADCSPRPGVVARAPETGCFYAGNWRSGRPIGKPSVNGQVIFSKSQFEAVNGYSEVIRTYGRDDEDFYDRLIAAGFERREIAPDLLDFLDHSDAERTANQFDADSRLPIEKRIVRDLLYCEMRNYYLAQRMLWGASQRRATFQEIRADDRLTVLRRDRAAEIVIPGEIEREAHLFALRFVTTQLAGISLQAAERLDERACLILIASRSKPVAHPVGAKRVVAASPSGSPRANGVRGRTANALAPSAASNAVARVGTQPLSSAAQSASGASTRLDALRGRHILLYTDDPGSGGVAQYNHALMLALVRSGCRVSCVQTASDSPMVAEQKAAGVTHHWLDYHTNRDFARTLTDGACAETLFANDAPDLVIFSDCCPVSNMAAREVAVRHGLPYVVVVGFVAPYLATNFFTQLSRLAVQHREAAEVVAVAEENLRLLRELFGTPSSKGCVIHYGRPARFFAPRDQAVRARLRAELNLPRDAVVAFTSARLTEVKGYDIQLQAIAQLRRGPAGRDVHWVWAGDGDQAQAIAEVIATCGLKDRVHLIGQRWDVADWLDAADIFVLPSRLEGMPLCIMEAMAKGLPVVATAVSGIPDEMGPTGKLLLNPAIDAARTAAELAQTLAVWATNPGVRAEVGARARARAEQLFREELMLERTLALIAQHARKGGARVSSAAA